MGGVEASEMEAVLARVRARREALYDAMRELEAALEAPDGRWATRLRAALERLTGVLRTHARETDEPGGFFDEIIRRAPRLQNAVESRRREHGTLLAAAREMVGMLPAETAAEVDAVREAGIALLADLARHRQHGADLIYEATMVDIGGQG